MHRVKGLEFNRIILAGVNRGIIPHENLIIQACDPLIRKEIEVHERALFYVAATRVKKDVIVTSFGQPSKFIRDFQ